MKRLTLAVVALAFTLVSFAKVPSTVNEKVLTAFSSTFKNATEVSWHEYTDYYEVRFIQASIDTRVKYDTEGNVLQSMRYYSEEALPLLIKAKLRNKFADKKVFGVTEIAQDNQVDYYITLEDSKNWTKVKSDYFGNMTVEKKYKKA